LALWRARDLGRPWNDPRKDIRRKLRVNPEWFLVGERDGRVVGTVMAGDAGHRGWTDDLGVEPAAPRRGPGRALMAEAGRLPRATGRPKVNLPVRSINAAVIAFHRRVRDRVDEVTGLGRRLENDTRESRAG
jgi:ribosomal protein S18 acetylase RimI-like enzyme